MDWAPMFPAASGAFGAVPSRFDTAPRLGTAQRPGLVTPRNTLAPVAAVTKPITSRPDAAASIDTTEAATAGDVPALIAVAHGSRDPRSAATMAAVVADIAAARPGIDVRLAFLDLNAPSVDQVIDAVAAQGHTRAVVVPLLLGSAFHARVDLPGILDAARSRHPLLRLTQADVLGPDPRLVRALRDRVVDIIAAQQHSYGPETGTPVDSVGPRETDARPLLSAAQPMPTELELLAAGHSAGSIGVAVAAVGSSSAAANARTAAVARRLAAITGWHTDICFATTEPSLPQAISRLTTRGATHLLVAPWFLAPGLLTDRLLSAAPNIPHANAIGPHPALTEIVLDRYAAAIPTILARTA
ncbi:sirohydrochlorin chelatase [Nocardia arthritidis]|uniref:Sirohydrochlorin chelatase n=1 Tax=Nocardia arthritidis TaxID=228602 RepID=A0A6G9YB07_9NOCA|nr:sirohydrochlorin chelatase [Nocardia arthritidis]